MIIADKLNALSELIRTDPKEAANELRRMASQLNNFADRLDAIAGGVSSDSVFTNSAADRVRFKVEGPNGDVKQETDWIN